MDTPSGDAAHRRALAALVVFEVVGPRSPDALDAVGRYFAELDARFRGGFDPGLGGAGSDADSFSPPHGAFVLGRGGGQTVCCGGLARLDATTAEVKRMWVHPQWRGAGLARRLLAELEAHAWRRGCTRVVLDTNEVLTEAVAMYLACGYAPIERYSDNPYAHHWFEKLAPSSKSVRFGPLSRRRP